MKKGFVICVFLMVSIHFFSCGDDLGDSQDSSSSALSSQSSSSSVSSQSSSSSSSEPNSACYLTASYSSFDLNRWGDSGILNVRLVFIRSNDLTNAYNNDILAEGIEFYNWPCSIDPVTNASWSTSPVSTWAKAESDGSGAYFEAGDEFGYVTVASNPDATITIRLDITGLVSNINHVRSENSAAWDLAQGLNNGTVFVFGTGEAGLDSDRWFTLWGAPGTPFTFEGQAPLSKPAYAEILFSGSSFPIITGIKTNTITIHDTTMTNTDPIQWELVTNGVSAGNLTAYHDSSTGKWTNSITLGTNTSGAQFEFGDSSSFTILGRYSTSEDASANVVVEFITMTLYVLPHSSWDTNSGMAMHKWTGAYPNVSWPGLAMTGPDDDGYWSVTFDEYGSFDIVFNNVNAVAITVPLASSTGTSTPYYIITNADTPGSSTGYWAASKP